MVIPARDEGALIRALEALPWRFAESMPQMPHWYVLQHWAPEVVDQVRRRIDTRGYSAFFGRREYRYLHLGGFKYWWIPPVLNREPLPPGAPLPRED